MAKIFKVVMKDLKKPKMQSIWAGNIHINGAFKIKCNVLFFNGIAWWLLIIILIIFINNQINLDFYPTM